MGKRYEKIYCIYTILKRKRDMKYLIILLFLTGCDYSLYPKDLVVEGADWDIICGDAQCELFRIDGKGQKILFKFDADGQGVFTKMRGK
jgi:hypothetical protein